ncbi:conserved protein of unknown function (plasmid) [Candidatus Promineifilum breve]|jgi:hypothetical protein|uniref:AAA+ ATPase domain-containing protein n=1 Tax=Candidatus Promineifilum breve TaxID=1806508 RepID=A0A160T9C5_9CHLR|nr:AAA family ATPase [Candidatus Promineifilum breve]CUS06449.1 conserved protein of unknown function [Candidatus Promineifilum breve]
MNTAYDEPPTVQRWVFRTLVEARVPRAPTEYIVDKYLATHTLNVLYGAPGSLKSMIALSLGLCVAGGLPWLRGLFGGDQGATVIQSPVIWIDLDNGQRRTDERVDAMSKAMHLPDDAPFYYLSMPTPSLRATDVESMGLLHDEITRLSARMVVIDNLGLVTGTVEENSAEMAQVMKNFRWLAEETGAAFLILHHQRKGGANGSRPGDALRGHSSIEAAIDLALHAVREANSNQVGLRSTKTRGVDVPNAVMEFSYEHVPGTNDLSNAYFTSVAVRQNNLLLKQSLLSFAEGNSPHGIPKNRLRELVYDDLAGEFSHGKIRAEMDHLIEVTGELGITEGRQGAKLVILSGGNGVNNND